MGYTPYSNTKYTSGIYQLTLSQVVHRIRLVIIHTMKYIESRELRELSMNQLNAKLSELYKELPRRNPNTY